MTGGCGHLPAIGTWENVSPPTSNWNKTYSGIDSIAIRPDNPEIVYAGADSNGLFKSTDCGETWTFLNKAGDDSGSGRPWSMAIDPVVPDTMYLVQGYGTSGLFKSSDAGLTWRQVLSEEVTSVFTAGGQITGISIDPTDHQHIVVECHGGGGTKCGDETCLAETADAGGTWTLRYIVDQPWSEGNSVVILSRKVWLYPAVNSPPEYTLDGGVTWVHATQAGKAYGGGVNYYVPYVYRGSDGAYYMPTHNGPLLKSAPNDISSWSQIDDTPGSLTVMPTERNVVMSDEFSLPYHIASQADLTQWAELKGPPQSKPNNQGGGGASLA
jgi:hypothetical protein